MSDFSKPDSISEQSVNIMRTLTHGISKCLEQFSQIPDDIKFSEESYGKFCAYLQQACLCLYHQQESYQYAYVVEFIDLVKQLLCQKIFKPLYDVQLKKMAPLKDQLALVAVTISTANEMQRSGPPKDGQKYHQFLAYLVFCFKQLG